jgi:hypothetical protein
MIPPPILILTFAGLAPSFIDNPVQAIARADFHATSCAMRALQ